MNYLHISFGLVFGFMIGFNYYAVDVEVNDLDTIEHNIQILLGIVEIEISFNDRV